MTRFDEKTPLSSLVLTFAGVAFMGILAGGISYAVIDWLTSWLPSQIISPALLIGAAAAVLTLMGALRTPRQISVTDQELVLTPITGSPRRFRLDSHRFTPHLTYSRGQVVGRSIKAMDAGGTEQHLSLGLDAHQFDRLMNALNGPVVAPQGAGQPGAAAVATPPQGVGRPLSFEPVTFTIKRGAATWMGALMIGLGVFIAAIMVVVGWDSDSFPATLVMGAFFLALFGGIGAYCLVQRGKIPSQVTVAPTWVGFDQRRFAYADLYAMQVSAPGVLNNLKVNLMTMDRQRIDIPVSFGRLGFADYDTFARLILPAANAVKPIATYSYAG